MYSRFFAHDMEMETILTQNGSYYIVHALSGELLPQAKTILQNAAASGADFIYADECIIGDETEKVIRKPAWSPDTLRSVAYIGNIFALSDALLRKLDMPWPLDADERYLFCLRATAKAGWIRHLPEVLYRGRAEVPKEPRAMVAAALRAETAVDTVEHGLLPGTVSVRYAVPLGTRVSILVFGNEDVVQFRNTLESIDCRNTYPSIELLVADNGMPEERKSRYYQALEWSGAVRDIIRIYGEKNLAKLCNRAARQCSGDTLLFVPAGMELMSHDGIARMLELTLQPHSGTVSSANEQDMVHQSRSGSEKKILHNVDCATEMPMMVRRDRFWDVGGFDETFAQSGFQAALSWVLRYKRLHNIYTPYCTFQIPAGWKPAQPDETNEQRLKDLKLTKIQQK